MAGRLPPEVLARLSAAIGIAYGRLDDFLVQRLIQRLVQGAPPLPADVEQWRIEKMLLTGDWKQEALDIMRASLQEVPNQVERLFYTSAMTAVSTGDRKLLEEAAKKGYIRSAAPLSEARASFFVSKMKEQALDSLNLINTSMIARAEQQYLDILNTAAGLMNTSDITMANAITTATRQLQEKGFQGFYDRRGRRWDTQAAVEMILRTNANSVATQATFSAMDDMGVDLILTSSHLGARPRCFEDQGQIFDRKNQISVTTDKHGKEWPVRPWSGSSYGLPDGMLGINCRHHIGYWIPGMSENLQKQYDYSENERRYKAEQKQRGLERKIRKNKARVAAATATGDEAEIAIAKGKLRESQAGLRQYLSDTGLSRSRAREQYIPPPILSATGGGGGISGAPITTKSIDSALAKAQSLGALADPNRRVFAQNILDHEGLPLRAQVHNIGPNAAGQCRTLYEQGRLAEVLSFELSSNDKRSDVYKTKTIFHELFHAKVHGGVHDMPGMVSPKMNGWLKLEEVFAETTSHYIMSANGFATNLAPSYSEYLVETLPKLKQTTLFKGSSTLADFGKVAMQFRYGAKPTAMWGNLRDDLTSIQLDTVSYIADNYLPYLEQNKEKLMDKVLENMVTSKQHKPYMMQDLEMAIISVRNRRMPAPSSNERFVLMNVMGAAFSMIGVR